MAPRLDKKVKILNDAEGLPKHVEHKLQEYAGGSAVFDDDILYSPRASAVLFLLGRRRPRDYGDDTGPFLILNKRSAKVKQPGDLCCPGGSIVPRLDVTLARLLRLRGSPLARWAGWPEWRERRQQEAFSLSLLLATGLRESFEEMRLNPFGIRFLGFLPPARLVMFRRVIYPMVCWISGQVRFFPNWEVEKVVAVPLSRLMEATNYARCVMTIAVSNDSRHARDIKEFPCFLHNFDGRTERLWGATFRITMSFLDLVFGFTPPAVENLQAVQGTLGRHYLTGRPAVRINGDPS
ncbi:MAG: CoA pyrophosphatase [Desulfobacterales bacterium]